MNEEIYNTNKINDAELEEVSGGKKKTTRKKECPKCNTINAYMASTCSHCGEKLT